MIPVGTPTQRDSAGRFRPGASPNPGGRPKAIRHLIEAARAHTADAVDALASIVRNASAPANARVAAASELLSRGWGRAPQTLAVSVHDNLGRSLNSMSDEQLLALAAAGGALGPDFQDLSPDAVLALAAPDQDE